MANLLAINSSAAREDSTSRVLVEEAVARRMEVNPGVVVVRRDLCADPIPHLAADRLARGVPKPRRSSPPGYRTIRRQEWRKSSNPRQAVSSSVNYVSVPARLSSDGFQI